MPHKLHQIQWTRLRCGVTSPAFVGPCRGTILRTDISRCRSSAPTPVNAPPARRRNRQVVWIPLGTGTGNYRRRRLVRVALFRSTPSGGNRGGPSIAARRHAEVARSVLPFVDLSEKKDQKYLAAGSASPLHLWAGYRSAALLLSTPWQFAQPSHDLRRDLLWAHSRPFAYLQGAKECYILWFELKAMIAILSVTTAWQWRERTP